MDRYQIGNFRLARNDASGDLLLLVNGPSLYKAVLGRAFPALYFSRTFPDRFGLFSWGTYIRGAGAAEEAALTNFCHMLQSAVLIDDDLDESFALAFHTQTSAAGGYERTPVGQLVYEAKPYERTRHPGDRQRAVPLAALLVQFIQDHPTYRRADVALAIPPSNPHKDFDLPTTLVEQIGKQAGKALAPGALRKTRDTRPMKDCRTIQDKIENLKDAFAVDPGVVNSRAVLLIDDIYQTGFSMNEVGRVVRAAGAELVLGLAATKTAHDLAEDETP